MSWGSLYRIALLLLPAGLRRKHGLAMESLFARELERASERGRLHGALAGAAGVWDVVRRGVYEQLRQSPDTAGEGRDHRPLERWSMGAEGPEPLGTILRGPCMSQPTTQQLLRR